MDKLNLKEIPENISKSEFLKYLTIIIALMKKVKDQTKGEKGDMGSSGEVGPMGPMGAQGFPGLDGVNGIDGRDGRDGKDAEVDLESLASQASELALTEVLAVVPTLQELEADLPKLGEPIRDALELLPEGEKLKIEAIENLREELDDLKKRILAKNGMGFVGGGGGGRIMKAYDLSPLFDGVTKTFNLPTMWRIIGVHMTNDLAVLRENIDFTYTPTSITFTSEIDASTRLANGEVCVIQYAE